MPSKRWRHWSEDIVENCKFAVRDEAMQMLSVVVGSISSCPERMFGVEVSKDNGVAVLANCSIEMIGDCCKICYHKSWMKIDKLKKYRLVLM